MWETDQTMKRALLLLSTVLLAIGTCGGPMITRLYFIHGGKRVWLSSCLETSGFPILFIPLLTIYLLRRRKEGSKAKFYFMEGPEFISAAIIGVLTGLDDFLYTFGVSRIPLSTSALLMASHLAFTAFFSLLLVKQKFTPYSINTVVLLTIGSGILALHTSGDRRKGESSKQYYLGVLMTVAGSLLYGLILPLLELITYKRAKEAITYTLLLEIQLVMCLFGTLVCTMGMIINKDFKAIPREARAFGLGETTYYMVLVWSCILWQGFFLGVLAVIFAGSSLLCGIIMAAILPMTEILAVVFYDEKLTAEKGISLILSLWGFVSYFYGEIKHMQNSENDAKKEEIPQNISLHHCIMND